MMKRATDENNKAQMKRRTEDVFAPPDFAQQITKGNEMSDPDQDENPRAPL